MKFPKPEKRPKAKRKPLKRGKPLKRAGFSSARSRKGSKAKREPEVVAERRLSKKEKDAILERDGWQCQRCDLETELFFDLVLEARSLIPDPVFVGTARASRPDLVLESLTSHDLFASPKFENVRTALVEGRPPAEVDHITPLWLQGTNDPENLETLCAHCHGEKTKVEAGQRARLPSSRKAR